MIRPVFFSLFAACGLSLLPAQVAPPPYDPYIPETGAGNNPPPDDYPDDDECEACKENSAGGGDSGGDGKYKSPSEDASGKTCGEDKENDSIRYTVGLGTTTYTSKNNFVGRDLGKRKPKFTKYNPPTTDVAPFSSSLSAEWKNRLTRPVVIGLATDEITDATFTPSVLEIRSGNAGAAWVKKDASGALRQILSDQYLTDITVPSTGGVLISSYLRSTIGGFDSSSGLYNIPANARKFRTVLISRPTPTGLNTVDITTTDYSSSETMPKIRGARWVKSGTGPAADWTLTHHTGSPTAQNQFSSDELVKQDLGNGLIQRTRTIRKLDSNGNPVVHSITREKYRDLGNNTLRIVERVEAPGTPEELTASYTYTDITGTGTVGVNGTVTQSTAGASANLLTGARLHSLQRSDGYWEEYKYQYNGGTKIMLTEKWSVWKNSAIGDKANSRHTTITLEENARTVIEKIAGQIVSNEYEKLTIAADGTRTLREEKKTGAATTPLITEHAYFPDTAAEPNKGRIQYTRHSNGTLTRYTYATAAGGLKTTIERGSAGADQFAPAATGPVPALTAGTRTETITNSFEKVIETKTWDIASELLIEQALATAVDAVGRPTHIVHDGDPDDYETFTFACCGVKTHRARDGSLTDYTKDALDRPTLTTVTLGPKTTSTGYAYATETLNGRVLPKATVTRSITAGSNSTGSLLVSESINDLRGQTLLSRSPDANGDNSPETTTYTHNSATRTESATGPDNVTATWTRYADGQSHTSVSTFGGNAITPLTTYDYAPHNTNGGGIKTTVQLSADNLTLKTETSFADLADRTFRTESPGYNGATLITETSLDERGRATGQSSTGKPATKRVLNFLGETTESWTDSNGDGQFNDTAVTDIKDSVTKATSDYVTEDNTICQRTRQWVRNDGDSDILLSTTFSSTDGTYQKLVPLAGTNPVTLTTASKPINGNASSTTSTNIGTGTLTQINATTLNADGTTSSVTQNKDTTGVPVTTATQVADLQGRTISVSDGRKPATSYSEFTAAGTPRKTTNSDGTYTITTLDGSARPTKQETYKADTTLIATVNTTHDSAGRVQAQWGTNTVPTYRDYDIQGRMKHLRTYRSSDLTINPTTITAPASFDLTTWDYESTTGLLLSKTDANDKAVQYTYTADGKLHTREWGRGITTTYGYTPSGQLTTTNYSDATPDVTITFDRLGRQMNQTNGIAQSAFAYDPATLALDTETISYNLDGQPGFEFSRVLDRSRDSLGRNTGFQLKDGSTVENQAIYSYSGTDGRLSSISNPQISNVPFTYEYVIGSDLIDAITGPVHTVDNVWEDARDVLDVKENKVGITTISKYDYGVNELGQRTTVSQTGTAFAAARGIVWGYDLHGQVTSADSTEASHDRAYQYDTIGNRIEARSGSTTVTGTPNYVANNLNQYTYVGTDSPLHDDDGNMTSGEVPAGSAGLVWDAENRLTAAQVNGHIIHYAYDSKSRRVMRTAGTDTTIYLYNSWNVIAELSSPNFQSPISCSRSYIWGLDISGTMQGDGGVGGLLCVSLHSVSIKSYYPTYDENGNICEYLDNAGAIAAHFEYDPFGSTVVNTDAPGIFNYRFSTKPLDATTGLYYYGYRYYDPQCGRWPSRDPLGETGGVNLYLFAHNNSVSYHDYLGYIAPSGQQWQKNGDPWTETKTNGVITLDYFLPSVVTPPSTVEYSRCEFSYTTKAYFSQPMVTYTWQSYEDVSATNNAIRRAAAFLATVAGGVSTAIVTTVITKNPIAGAVAGVAVTVVAAGVVLWFEIVYPDVKVELESTEYSTKNWISEHHGTKVLCNCPCDAPGCKYDPRDATVSASEGFEGWITKGW